MSKREDYLSALRTDIVRVLRETTGAPEATAARVASEVIKAMRLRYHGKTIRVGKARISSEQIRAAFDGRNHRQVCRDLGISRRTLYRALQRGQQNAPSRRGD